MLSATSTSSNLPKVQSRKHAENNPKAGSASGNAEPSQMLASHVPRSLDASYLSSNGQKPHATPHSSRKTRTGHSDHFPTFHCLGFRRMSRLSEFDLELQPLDVERAVQVQRDRLSLVLFGKHSADRRTSILPTAYLNHLQDQIHSLGKDRLNTLLGVLHTDTPASDDCYLSVLVEVSEILREDQREDKSIHNILQNILAAHGVAENELIAQTTIDCWQSIFLVLCWLTLIFQPSPAYDAGTFPVPLPSCCIGMQKPQRVDAARRPITRLLNGFGNLLPELDQDMDSQSTSLLYASSLNYHALDLFGRVTIEWTNCMSAHLRFHRATRTLHLFRFPSVCAMYLEIEENVSIFRSVLGEHFLDPDSSSSLHQQYLQEILLSYRVIFGQGRSSRMHFMTHEKPRVADKNLFDPLLIQLCGKKNGKSLKSLGPSLWPETCLNFEGELQEQDVYDTNLDFRFLGARLLELQAYNLRQEPSRIRDLWRDRRNALQWYTFWAVIFVGGLTVLLALIQCFIAAAQLYFTIRPP